MQAPQEEIEAPQDNSSSSPWDGDILDRKGYAEFLTRYLKQKTLEGDGLGRTSFTLAIDAEWGQGKTFFVSNWEAALASEGYPTMIFDAWKADYAEDPVVAFMAEFKLALDQKIKSEGLTDSLHTFMDKAISSIRRAILPASKQIIKSLFHKGTGIATDEIIAACSTASNQPATVAEALKKDGLKIVNEGLDKFFEKALEEHEERKQAIDEFRSSVKMTLQKLVTNGKVSLPMFVFIDELDRCRPNFAISLLEGVKHLFGIPGVCFVVSTNLTQLSHSIKAVYGEGFDGQAYLKRFFDVESTLPKVTGIQYMEVLLQSYPEFQARPMALGLPENGFQDQQKMNAAYALTWVAESFSIDLRSQRTLIEMISAAMSGIPADKKVFLLWLAAICAIKIKSSETYEQLYASRKNTQSTIDHVIKHIHHDNKKTLFLHRRRETIEHPIYLHEVLKVYSKHQAMNLVDIPNISQQDHNNLYPHSILREIAQEAPALIQERTFYPTSISTYFDLVKHAGYLSSQ